MGRSLRLRRRDGTGREIERAKILLRYAEGASIFGIGRELGLTRRTVYKGIDKALAAGVETGLKDKHHRPKAPEAARWVVSLACTHPKDHDLAAALCTLSALAGWVRAGAVAVGHECLYRAAKATIWRILNAHDIKPHRVRYYLERRGATFEHKMLVVYWEIGLELTARETTEPRPRRTIRRCRAYRRV